jgi:phosphoglycolate phosphatase-like HAD superfamily hydrolase
MTRRIVIFDFNGTLADTVQELVDALAGALGDLLGADARRRRDEVMRLVNLPPREMIRAVVDLTG